MKIKKIIISIIVIVAAGVCAFAGSNTSDEVFVLNRVYIGVSASHNIPEGDFDGISFLADEDEVVLIPKIDPALGYKVYMGRSLDLYSHAYFDIGYMHADPAASWGGVEGESFWDSYYLEAKYCFKPNNKISPYLLFGLSYEKVNFKEASANISEVGDAIFIGNGLYGGLGISFCLSRRLMLKIDGCYKTCKFGRAKGVENQYKSIPEGGINSSVMNYSVGLEYAFFMRDIAKKEKKKRKTAKDYIEEGKKYSEENDFVKALKSFNKALKVDPEYKAGHYYRGVLYYMTEKYEKAMKDLDVYMAYNSEYSKAYYYRAKIFMLNNDMKSALNNLNNAIKVNDEKADYYFERAKCHEVRGDRIKAINDYYDAGKLYLKDEDLDNAKKCVYNIRVLKPKSLFADMLENKIEK